MDKAKALGALIGALLGSGAGFGALMWCNSAPRVPVGETMFDSLTGRVLVLVISAMLALLGAFAGHDAVVGLRKDSGK